MSRVECMRRVLLTLHVFKCPCQQRQADNSAVGSPVSFLHVFKCPCQQRQADNSALRGVFLREIIYATTP